MSSNLPFEKVGECLYRNPSSRKYYALIKLKGKQHKQSLKTTDLAEAKRKLRDYRVEVESTSPKSSKVTMEDICQKYLQTIQDQSPSTRQNKQIMLGKAQVKWENTRVRDLKKSDILEWLTSLELGASWQNQHLQVLRAALKLAVDDGIIYRSPLEGVKEKKLSKPVRMTPNVGDFQAIVESIRSQPLADTADESADYVEFMGLAGLGQAESSTLTWANVDFERGKMVVFRHKTKQGFVIPVYPQVLPLLKRRWTQACVANGGKIPHADLKVFTVKDAKKAIASACARLGFPKYSARSFRRLFITRAIEKGVDVKVIAAWQGHRDGGKLILDTYSHVRPSHGDQMAKLMTIDAHSNVLPDSEKDVARKTKNFEST